MRRTATWTAPLILGTALLAGCGPGWTDSGEGMDAAHALQIQIPDSATDVHRRLGSDNTPLYAVDFLMPNDQWRDYVGKYYPGKSLVPYPADNENNGSVPAACIAAFRAGVKLISWVASDKIPFDSSKKAVDRGVVITPDCHPGLALLNWRLDKNLPTE